MSTTSEYQPKLPTLALPDDCYDICWFKDSSVSAEPSSSYVPSTRVSISGETSQERV